MPAGQFSFRLCSSAVTCQVSRRTASGVLRDGPCCRIPRSPQTLLRERKRNLARAWNPRNRRNNGRSFLQARQAGHGGTLKNTLQRKLGLEDIANSAITWVANREWPPIEEVVVDTTRSSPNTCTISARRLLLVRGPAPPPLFSSVGPRGLPVHFSRFGVSGSSANSTYTPGAECFRQPSAAASRAAPSPLIPLSRFLRPFSPLFFPHHVRHQLLLSLLSFSPSSPSSRTHSLHPRVSSDAL